MTEFQSPDPKTLEAIRAQIAAMHAQREQSRNERNAYWIAHCQQLLREPDAEPG